MKLAFAAIVILLGCSSQLGGKPGQPLTLPQKCQQGPFCVTGQVTDMSAGPIEGAACSVLGPRGEGYGATTDARGFFYIDLVPVPPKMLRCSKAGYETQTPPLPTKAQGSAAPIYVQMPKSLE